MKAAISTLDQIMRKYTPDPFVIALLMTFLVAILAWLMTPTNPPEVIEAWGAGFWKLINFTLQMVMIPYSREL